jgi:hypothetical protein
MNKTLLLVAMAAALTGFVSATDLLPVHLGDQAHVISGRHTKSYSYLFFCPPRTCLYYAGDLNSTNTETENGLFDYENPGIGITDAEVWAGVKPNHDVVVTGTSGNMLTNNPNLGINPTPFAVQVGITGGNGGTVTCTSGGNATEKSFTGLESSFGLDGDNYYIKKLGKPCRLKGGKVSYLWISPQYNDGSTIGYLADAEPPNKHHTGWKVDNDDSYFNSSSFGAVYEPTWGSSGACGGIGCDAFSISVSGHKAK